MTFFIDQLIGAINFMGFGTDLIFIALALGFALLVTHSSFRKKMYGDTAITYILVTICMSIFGLIEYLQLIVVTITPAAVLIFMEIKKGKGT